MVSSVFTTFSASSTPPSPPFSHTSARANSQPLSSQNSLTNATLFRSICNKGIQSHNHRNIIFLNILNVFLKIYNSFFQCIQIFFTQLILWQLLHYTSMRAQLQLKLLHLGARPATRHLISINFSAPRSAPNPASVIAISPNFQCQSLWHGHCYIHARYLQTGRHAREPVYAPESVSGFGFDRIF